MEGLGFRAISFLHLSQVLGQKGTRFCLQQEKTCLTGKNPFHPCCWLILTGNPFPKLNRASGPDSQCSLGPQGTSLQCKMSEHAGISKLKTPTKVSASPYTTKKTPPPLKKQQQRDTSMFWRPRFCTYTHIPTQQGPIRKIGWTRHGSFDRTWAAAPVPCPRHCLGLRVCEGARSWHLEVYLLKGHQKEITRLGVCFSDCVPVSG